MSPARSLPLADRALRGRSAALDLTLVTLTALATALASELWLPIPGSPVPVTGQTLVVLASGALLGARRGAASQLLYLVLGAAGLPFFAAGAMGPLRLLGPTGGYLAAFPVAAWLVGHLAERGWDRRFSSALAAMALGNAVIYALGLTWLARFVPAGALLASGLLPFLLGDAVKAVLAALSLPALGRRVR